MVRYITNLITMDDERFPQSEWIPTSQKEEALISTS